jgi:hypothetical protein
VPRLGGQPWTFAVTRPHGVNGLNARRMAVLWTFREPSLGCHVHRALLRSVWLDVTPITLQRHLHEHALSHNELWALQTLMPLVIGLCKTRL